MQKRLGGALSGLALGCLGSQALAQTVTLVCELPSPTKPGEHAYTAPVQAVAFDVQRRLACWYPDFSHFTRADGSLIPGVETRLRDGIRDNCLIAMREGGSGGTGGFEMEGSVLRWGDDQYELDRTSMMLVNYDLEHLGTWKLLPPRPGLPADIELYGYDSPDTRLVESWRGRCRPWDFGDPLAHPARGR